jgi:hypothetical protein
MPHVLLRANVELESNAHTSKLNVQKLENTRHRNNRYIFTTRVPHSGSVHPQICFAAIRISWDSTSPTADDKILAAPILLPTVFCDSGCGAEEGAAGTAYRCFGVVGTVH